MLGRQLPGARVLPVPPPKHVVPLSVPHAFAVASMAGCSPSVAAKAWHPTAIPKKETKFSAALLQLVFPIEIITLPQFWVVYRGTPVRAGCSLFI
jgi:hypothetical protein